MPETTMTMRRILILEPYYGGSHKLFLQGVQKWVEAEYETMTLPARKWKMRMQLSAPWFVEQIKKLEPVKRWFDVVLCSTFVDVAVLRALLSGVPDLNPHMRFLTYFHENQFVYPDYYGERANFQFTAINFNTALASDSIAFNSEFNRNSFLEGCRSYVKKAADMVIRKSFNDIVGKCRVLYPGLDFSSIDSSTRAKPSSVPTILWNHRWEHDKNPESFFKALYAIKDKNIPFRLMVLGQAFKHQPECFAKARKLLAREIIHYGYVESRKDYTQLINSCDLVVSTSLHEFFGISVLEAVRAGCWPLVPARLSYPELFEEKYLYSDDTFLDQLETCLLGELRLSKKDAKMITDKYSWPDMAGFYEKWLFLES